MVEIDVADGGVPEAFFDGYLLGQARGQIRNLRQRRGIGGRAGEDDEAASGVNVFGEDAGLRRR